ncbi:MAG TPA: GspE/PulE family protein [Candidatus Paceibacterota bacterium]|nr:GspE/PulE family protein [Candidatus Paceibacterota bacterium]
MADEKLTNLDLARLEEEAQDLALKLNVPYLDLATVSLNLEALKIIPEIQAKKIQAVVFDQKPGKYYLATVNPEREEVKKLIKEIKKFGEIEIFVVSVPKFEKFLENYRFLNIDKSKIIGEISISDKYLEEIKNQRDVKSFLESFFSQKFDITEMIYWIIAYALAYEASDLHLEPHDKQADLRYRIDGVLYKIAEIPINYYFKITDRLKLISGVNLNVRDIPQDGRFKIKTQSAQIEVRFSTIPSQVGENLVLRFLNPKTISLELENLGLREKDILIVENELKKPNGLILVTGPTGSGKTTTLYAFLKKVANPENKVITIEDPIEYQLPIIEQTQVNNQSGYTFANGLRAILRQDPDIILVGEIRDEETAQIAMHASLTGHLVFSTLHTNNAPGAVPRLLDFKIEPEIISSALNLIIAQRLVRKVCQNCAQEIEIPENIKEKIKNTLLLNAPKLTGLDNYLKITKYKKPIGCQQCNFTGYKGRIGVFEILSVNDQMQNLINSSPDEIKIKKMALENGMTTMLADGLIKVLDGITDLEELERMVGPLENKI